MTDVVERQSARSRLPTDPITRWLLLVAVLVALMVVLGGFVRLSRAGLSVVEWDVVGGVLPPIGEAAWDEAFDAYQQTPEYQLVNEGMTLGEFKRIYYYEWGHRLVARFAGLAVVLPLIWFMWRRRLTVRESLRYWGIAALFGAQGYLGWLMVSSGLRDRPVVSHYRLTIHLLAALLLLALAVWMALNRMAKEEGEPVAAAPAPSRALPWAWALLGVVVVQMAFGGLVAGQRAGHLSNTWPLMSGSFLPDGVLNAAGNWLSSLVEPLGSHWVHRWLAFVVLAVAVVLVVQLRTRHAGDRRLQSAVTWLLVVLGAQIALGIWVVLANVAKWIALAHQANGVLTFTIALVIVHRLRIRGAPVDAS